MLTKEDLQAVAEIVGSAVAASENRMDAKRAAERAADKEEIKNHMNVVIESQVMPAIRQIADGVIQANDRLDRVESRLDALEATVAAHELYIIHRSAAQN